MEHIKYLIIGGGVTGLSFANFINSDDYLILEKEKTLGGYCRTVYNNGFIWDYSGHFFHFRDQEIHNFLISRMPTNSLVKIVRNSKIFYRKRLIDFPFQKNIHQLEKDDFIDCLYHLFFKSDLKEYVSFKDMLYKRFGEAITEKFLLPYNEKLYTCDLDKLDFDAMGRFFPYADINEIIRNFKYQDNHSYNSTFIYANRGAMQFIDALTKDLATSNISTEEEVKKIDVKSKIVYTTKRNISFDYLITTIPFNRILGLVGWCGDTDSLSWNKVLVFNIGFDSKGPLGIHWIYFPEKDYRFYRVGFYDNILNSKNMSLYVEIGLPRNSIVNLEEELEITLNHLRKAQILTTQQLITYHSVVLDPAYVHISKSSCVFFQKVDSSLKASGIHSIGRYGGWKYCSIEDNIIEAKNVAEQFNDVEAMYNCDG